jgi:hypothetical protein
MLVGMRLQIEVRREDEDSLRSLAFDSHRSVREQASFLLHLKIQEEIARLNPEGSAGQLESVA